MSAFFAIGIATRRASTLTADGLRLGVGQREFNAALEALMFDVNGRMAAR